MFDNKLLVSLYILDLDKKFDLFLPVDEKVGNVIKLLDKSFVDIVSSNKKYILFNLYSARTYNNNDLIRNTDIQNGTKLMLI